MHTCMDPVLTYIGCKCKLQSSITQLLYTFAKRVYYSLIPNRRPWSFIRVCMIAIWWRTVEIMRELFVLIQFLQTLVSILVKRLLTLCLLLVQAHPVFVFTMIAQYGSTLGRSTKEGSRRGILKKLCLLKVSTIIPVSDINRPCLVMMMLNNCLIVLDILL